MTYRRSAREASGARSGDHPARLPLERVRVGSYSRSREFLIRVG